MPIIKGPLSVSEIRVQIADAVGTVKYGDLATRIDIHKHNKLVATLIPATAADFLAEIIILAEQNRQEEIGNFVKNYLYPPNKKED